jgi:Ca2+:H+ antiporter
MTIARTPWWAWTWPVLAWVILSVTPFASPAGFIAAAAGVALILAVFAAVYHAEVVAHRTGEPFGTLVLAIAVTIIEVALIVSVMVATPAEKAGLARDTVFAAVMIVCNGIVGLCLLWGGARHHEQGFQVHGASAALAVLAALTMLTLVLPNFATSVPGPLFSTSQLVFVNCLVGCCTAHSFSSKPCGTETTSSQANPTTRKRTLRRHPTRPLPSAPVCCSPHSSPLWASRNHSRRRWKLG